MSDPVVARTARGSSDVHIVGDPDLIASHLTDAAHVGGGHAQALAAPDTEAAIAEVLRASAAVLPIGAQSSLTGGATPMGDVLLSTSRFNRIEVLAPDRVRVGAGVTLAALDDVLAQAGRFYPPAPTFHGASVGGTVATNAAGAATFKYGSTRPWVSGLTVVLPDGDVLAIERGQHRTSDYQPFTLKLGGRAIDVPIPRYQMPKVPKLSAGYFAGPDMDLIDLFIGSEGTLGIVTEVTLRVLPVRPAMCLAVVPFNDRAAALRFVDRLCDAAKLAWTTGGVRGVDVSGVECMDARSIALLREDGLDRLNGVTFAPGVHLAVIVSIELPPEMDAQRAFDEIGRSRENDAPDTALVRFCSMLHAAGVLDDVEIAVPGDHARAAQLAALREGVPVAVNRRVAHAQATIDGRIEKTAGDLAVPFDRLDEFFELCDDEFTKRGLDAAIWGHLSDGNLHPNVLPRSFADVEEGRAAILELGRAAIRFGGSPLAEHGVGRNRTKQQLLRDLYGDDGIEEMRKVKRAIDPAWKLAPGVIFGA